jgi:hypothetical protein
MKQESNILLIFLIILSLTTFTRTLVYYVFHSNLIKFDAKSKQEIDSIIEKVLLIFSIIRTVLVVIILYNRQFQKDILTGVLVFLFLSSIQRFTYHYLTVKHPESSLKKSLDKIQDINTILVLLSSLYIMKYVFF